MPKMLKGKSIDLEGLIEINNVALEAINKRIKLFESINSKNGNGYGFKLHQILRLYELYLNKKKKIFIGDCTSSGKTIVGLGAVGLLSRKHKKNFRVLLVAPDQASLTAWQQDSVNDYCNKFNLPKTEVLHVRNRKDLEKMKSKMDIEKGMNNDSKKNFIVALNYQKFSRDKGGSKYVSELEKVCSKFDMVISDECHNNKNPNSYRARGFERIYQKTKDGYYLLLSAAIPNSLKDVGLILHYLDEIYPLAKYDYKEEPNAIKRMKLDGKWFDFQREDLRKVFKKMPPLPREERLIVGMDDKYVKQYFNSWKPGNKRALEKIHALTKTLALSKIDFLKKMLMKGEFVNEKGEVVKLKGDEQIAIFTYHKTGIFNEIYRELNKIKKYHGKIKMIDGDNNLKERVETAKSFMNGDTRIVINTIKTMGEGIPYPTKGPYLIIPLEQPITPGDYTEIVGRLYRVDARAPGMILNLMSQSERLSKMMIEVKEYLERRYDVKFSSNWIPTTLDFDIYNLRRNKVIKYLMKIVNAIKLNGLEEKILNTDLTSSTSVKGAIEYGVLRSLLSEGFLREGRSKSGIDSQSFNAMVNSYLYGKPVMDQIEASLGKGKYANAFEKQTKMYLDKKVWWYSTSADASRLIKEVIKGLENKGNKKIGKILDVGCGNACLARILKRPLVNLDLSEKMLNNGKKECNRLELEYVDGGFKEMQFVKGIIQKTKFNDESFDLVNSCFSIMYAAQCFNEKENKNYREIEDGIKEANRVLKRGGYYFITLPGGGASLNGRALEKKQFKNLVKVLKSYGFKPFIKDFFSGYTEKNGDGRKIFGAYFIAAKKINGCNGKYKVKEGEFCMYPEYRHCATGGGYFSSLTPLSPKKECGRIKGRLISESFVGRNNGKLEDLVYRLR